MKKINLEYIIKNQGLTLDYNLIEQRNLNFVYSLPNYEMKFKTKYLSNSIFNSVLKYYQQIAKVKNAYIGLWIDDGFLYYDLSKNAKSRAAAIKKAIAFNQLAIFDYKNKETIYINA
jgi:hypothetical protein